MEGEEDQSEIENILQELTVPVLLWLAAPVQKSFILKGDTITSFHLRGWKKSYWDNSHLAQASPQFYVLQMTSFHVMFFLL